MLKSLIYTFFLNFCLAIPFLNSSESLPLSHSVLVSVAPHKFFVEKIAEKTVKVILMVPAGASAHTFEPNPKEMLAACNADMWFQIGENFEIKAGSAIKSHHPEMQFIDLAKDLSLISDSQCQHHHHSSYDLHFWLSPQQAKIQAQTIAEALIQKYPEHAAIYLKNLNQFLHEITELNKQIREIIAQSTQRTIMVSHPAYAYFCRDYDFTQLSIEFEGKDPTPKQLTRILQAAQAAKIQTIFIQPQYSNKGATLIASKIGAKLITLDPYSENYFETLLSIAKHFANQ